MSPRAAPNVRSTIASAPGPAMKGNASGKTETSLRLIPSTFSSGVVRVPDSRANTISSAIRNSMMPPAMRNASMLMPMILRNPAPPTANSRSTMPAMQTALSAILRRKASSSPSVIAANSGTSVTGSTTTKNSTKNLTTSSAIGRLHFLPCRDLAMGIEQVALRQPGEQQQPGHAEGRRVREEGRVVDRLHDEAGSPLQQLAEDRVQRREQRVLR